MYALLGRFEGIDEFFPTNKKICDLDRDFVLQWTHTDIDFSSYIFFATSISYTNSEHFQLQGQTGL